MSDWLNSNNVTLIFSGVVAVSTVVYAFLTWRLTDETMKLRKAQTEPNIAVQLLPYAFNYSHMYLVVKNIGNGLAKDIRCSVEPDIVFNRGHKLSEQTYFKQIKHLLPGEKIESLLLGIEGIGSDDAENSHAIRVEYNNSENNKIVSTYMLSIGQYRSMIVANSIEAEIKQEMRKISDALQKIANQR
ncbi:MAG: hypothetical protein HZC51_12655 [Nitrospirae bacterium]|nr:hypothetical protein [Nitrospirota bacterium]